MLTNFPWHSGENAISLEIDRIEIDNVSKVKRTKDKPNPGQAQSRARQTLFMRLNSDETPAPALAYNL